MLKRSLLLVELEKNKSASGIFFEKIFLIRHFRLLFRFKFKYLRWFLASIVTPAKVTAKTFWGRDIYLFLSDNAATHIYFLGAFVFPEIKLIKFIIKHLGPDSIFYDIGASYGFYSMLADLLLERGEIHFFEPYPEVFQLSKNNLNNSANKIFANNAAVSSKTGEVDFFKANYWRASGSTIVSSCTSYLNDYETIRVQAVNLDEYIKNNQPPTFIKMDAEGAESDIIKGGLELIGKNHPVISLEIWTRNNKNSVLSLAAADLLLSLGYNAYWLDDDGDLKAVGRDDMGCFDYWFDNYIFIHKLSQPLKSRLINFPNSSISLA